MTEKEFEAKVRELKEKYGIRDKFCFKMDANFKVDKDTNWKSKEQYIRSKTAAMVNFFSEAITTSSEEMQILEAAMLDKGNYAYIVSELHGVPSLQILRPVFLYEDGSPMKTPEELNLPDEPEQDKILGVLRYALKRAAKDARGEDGTPNILMQNAAGGEPYKKINDNGSNKNAKGIFMDYQILDLSKMDEKEKLLAIHVNTLFAEDNGVPPERIFVLETPDKEKAVKKLDEYMKEAGKEYIDNTYSTLGEKKGDENNFVYGADGKNCLVYILEDENKLLNDEPYKNLDEAFEKILKTIE